MRISIINMLKEAKSGHPGGSLSACEIVAALYFKVMNIDPNKPDWPERDRFVYQRPCSSSPLCCLGGKGILCQGGIDEIRKIDSMLQGHPDMKDTPGVDMTTGSLGQGFGSR